MVKLRYPKSSCNCPILLSKEYSPPFGLLIDRYFPEEFLDYYPDDVLDVPDNQYAPVNMPEKAWNVPPIFRQFTDTSPEALGIPDIGNINVTLPEWKAIFLMFRELEFHIK